MASVSDRLAPVAFAACLCACSLDYDAIPRDDRPPGGGIGARCATDGDCSEGLSCGGLDTALRCGEPCGPGCDFCLGVDAPEICGPDCEPITRDGCAGDYCGLVPLFVDPSALYTTRACYRPGDGVLGSACYDATQCGEGLFCARNPAFPDPGGCARLCRTEMDCGRVACIGGVVAVDGESFGLCDDGILMGGADL